MSAVNWIFIGVLSVVMFCLGLMVLQHYKERVLYEKNCEEGWNVVTTFEYEDTNFIICGQDGNLTIGPLRSLKELEQR